MVVLVDAERLSVRRSDRALFESIAVTVADGDRVGVVGINGTGKSTLLRVLAGTEEPDAGVVRRGRGVRIGLLDQRPELPAGPVSAAVGDGWEAAAILERLGMGAYAEVDVDRLSGGQAKRVSLARALVEPSELLVLDEPTNHLDMGAVGWLTRRLLGRPGGLILVTHDRHLLDAVSTRIVELDRGRAYVHEGGYESYLAARMQREAQASEAEAVRANLARRELAWLRRGAPARTRKPQARIDAATRIIEGRPDAPARGTGLDLAFSTPRLGALVIEAEGVSFSYGAGRPAVVAGVDLALEPGARLGIVGANGSGKSTLLDVLAGRREPTSGQLRRGPTVVVGYYDQSGTELDPAARVREVVAGPTRAPGGPEDKALMDRFWFGGALSHAPVSTLSGGERRRLQLLVVLATRPNVLLLDEPTNDLDLDTLRIVEDYLDEWPGTLVTVSHDRAFLERATDQIVALGPGGDVRPVAGGLAVWLAETEVAATARSAAATTRTGGRETGPAPRPVRDRAAGRPAGAGSGRSATTVGFPLLDAERTMARLGREQARLAVELEVASGHEEMARVGSALAEVGTELAETEERWLVLAEEAETGR
ncbi:MAG: ABC-F family ATP-binding cassette domain-containing protein [Acidimicrobiales bacterium]